MNNFVTCFLYAQVGHTFHWTLVIHCHHGILVTERKSIMAKRQRHHLTDEEKAELLSNPYTARITDCKVVFTLAFKQLVMENINTPGMTARKLFQMAGYSDSLFSNHVRRYTIASIRKEASSEKGLQEPSKGSPVPVKKKHTETEFRELQERVLILEQQVSFLKKSQLLKKQDHFGPSGNTD